MAGCSLIRGCSVAAALASASLSLLPSTCRGEPPAPVDGIDVDLFWRQGFLWIPGFINESEVAEIRRAMAELIDQWVPPTSSGAPGATSSAASTSPLRPAGNASANVSANASASSSSSSSSSAAAPAGAEERNHSFMLDSATKASLFLEAGAVNADGSLPEGADKRGAVRKVAHGLHLVPGPWRDFVHSPKVARLAQALGWRKPLVAQTLYRLARPNSAGVDRHQDSVTLYTEPPSVLGIWLALEDADESNGCLRVLPGSHRGPIRERLVRRSSGNCSGEGCAVHLTFERLSNATSAPPSEFEPLKTRAGDVLVMHGTTEHFSEASTDASRSRESLQVHLVEKTSRWPEDNWLQYPPGMAFEELAVPSDRNSPFSEL